MDPAALDVGDHRLHQRAVVGEHAHELVRELREALRLRQAIRGGTGRRVVDGLALRVAVEGVLAGDVLDELPEVRDALGGERAPCWTFGLPAPTPRPAACVMPSMSIAQPKEWSLRTDGLLRVRPDGEPAGAVELGSTPGPAHRAELRRRGLQRRRHDVVDLDLLAEEAGLDDVVLVVVVRGVERPERGEDPVSHHRPGALAADHVDRRHRADRHQLLVDELTGDPAGGDHLHERVEDGRGGGDALLGGHRGERRFDLGRSQLLPRGPGQLPLARLHADGLVGLAPEVAQVGEAVDLRPLLARGHDGDGELVGVQLRRLGRGRSRGGRRRLAPEHADERLVADRPGKLERLRGRRRARGGSGC